MLTASHCFSVLIQCGLFMIDVPNIKHPSGSLLKLVILCFFPPHTSLYTESSVQPMLWSLCSKCIDKRRSLTYQGGQEQPSVLTAVRRVREGVICCCESVWFVITSWLGCCLCTVPVRMRTREENCRNFILLFMYWCICVHFGASGRSGESAGGWKSWAQVGANRLAFGHRHKSRDHRDQTQTRSDSLSTVKVKVFITSELPSICGCYLFTASAASSLTSSQWHSGGQHCGILKETIHCMKFSPVILKIM